MPMLDGGACASRERPTKQASHALPRHEGRDAQGFYHAGCNGYNGGSGAPAARKSCIKHSRYDATSNAANHPPARAAHNLRREEE